MKQSVTLEREREEKKTRKEGCGDSGRCSPPSGSRANSRDSVFFLVRSLHSRSGVWSRMRRIDTSCNYTISLAFFRSAIAMKGIHSSREPRASCELGRSAQTRVASCTLANVSHLGTKGFTRFAPKVHQSPEVFEEEEESYERIKFLFSFANQKRVYARVAHTFPMMNKKMNNWRAKLFIELARISF